MYGRPECILFPRIRDTRAIFVLMIATEIHVHKATRLLKQVVANSGVCWCCSYSRIQTVNECEAATYSQIYISFSESP